jgi:hypothetical protein
MGLRIIVAYLDCKRLSAAARHKDIVATLGPNIEGYGTSTRYLREMKFPLSTERSPMPMLEGLFTTPMMPSCPISARVYLRLCGSSRNSSTSIQRLFTVA